MTSSSLPDRLKRLVELQPCEISKTNNQFKHGRRTENARLAPLIHQLIQCLIQADEMRDELSNFYGGSVGETNYLKALTALENACGKMEADE